MLSAQDTSRPTTIDELIGPELLAALDSLDILSRKVFAGKLLGERRSKQRGRSVEFDDYRPYVSGDDLRHIDWNVYARLEKFFLKLFYEEQDLSLMLIVDASASMDAGDPSKLVLAHRLAMALGYIGLVNLNRVTVARFDQRGLVRLAPMRGRPSVARLGAFLLDSLNPRADRPGEQPIADFNAAMRALATTRQGTGVVVLLSDLLVPEGLLPGLNYLSGARGWDASCLQILSPDELDPAAHARTSDLVGDLRLTDAETGRAAEVTISAPLIARYRQRLERFLDQTQKQCKARAIQHILVPSDADLRALLLRTLRQRSVLG